MKHIVVTGSDVLSTSIGGRGLRAIGIARALTKRYQVTLICGGDPGADLLPDVELAVSPQERSRALSRAEVVVTGSELTTREMVRFGGHLVADLYDPRMFQLLAADMPAASIVPLMREELRKQRRLWRQADIVVCATDDQRDLYLGTFLASRSVRQLTSTQDLSWDRRVVVLANGIDQRPPVPDAGLRERLGLGVDDIVLIWGGGVWDWMDPAVLLEALDLARRTELRLRLVFLGIQREGRAMPLTGRHKDLVAGLRGLGESVVVNNDWIQPEARGAFLLASDAGVLAQRPGLEAHFSFRQRIVDCLWAALPIIATSGDPLSEDVARQGWGLVSPSGDAQALAANLVRYAQDGALRTSMRSAVAAAQPQWTWDTQCQPLMTAIDALPSSGRIRRAWRGADALPGVVASRAKARIGSSGT
jgi:glycosyltransferase involved in cell wall biosynthesis